MDRRNHHDPWLHVGSGSLFPAEAAADEVDPMPDFDNTMGSNNLPLSNSSAELPNHLPVNPGHLGEVVGVNPMPFDNTLILNNLPLSSSSAELPNHLAANQVHLGSGNVSSMLPIDEVVGGVNPMPYFSNTLRSNNLPLSSSSAELPSHGHLGHRNTSSMLPRDEAVGVVNPMPYFDPNLRVVPPNHAAANPYWSSSYARISNRMPQVYAQTGPWCIHYADGHPTLATANPGLSHNQYLHPSSASGSIFNRMPPGFFPVDPFYNPYVHGHASTVFDPQVEYGMVPLKRKNPAVSMTTDRGNTNIRYTAGSSSNLSVPSSSRVTPAPGPQYVACNVVSTSLGHMSNSPSSVHERSHRNVRFRQRRGPTRFPSTSNLSHHPSTNVSAMAASGQWMRNPICLDTQPSLSSGSSGFDHEMNQPPGGGSVGSRDMRIDAGYPLNSVHNRSSSTLEPGLPVMPMPLQVAGIGHDGSALITTSCSAGSNFLWDRQIENTAFIPFSSHLRPLSNAERIAERNMMLRMSEDSFYGVAIRRNESTFINARNLSDPHRDMRMDVDNMSYEELLALQERIGSVSTGLSEDTIPECLKESVYCSNGAQQEGNCVICLESYKDRDSLGRLYCGHHFHSSCMKSWLLLKNWCPICKKAALPDSSGK